MTIAVDKYFPLGPVAGEFPFTENGRRIVLTRDFAYVDEVDGKKIDIRIPSGFESDFNSTPRPLWVWFPPWECPEAGLPHDWLYRHPGTFDRAHIDRLHRRLMELKGERKSKRALAYLGIRAGGWKPWDGYRAAETAEAEHV